MVHNDETYVRILLAAGIIRSPCLEGGAGLEEHSLRILLENAGVEWFGTDIRGSGDRMFAVDLGASFEVVDEALGGRRFPTTLLLNVLEHVFDPIRVLDNACALLQPGGHCVVVTPTVWPLHYFPLDCWRINPNFYEEYCRRRGMQLVPEHFWYVTPYNRPVDRDADGNCVLPPPTLSTLRYWKSRFVHRAFDTFGRGMSSTPHVATGAVIRKR